MTESQPFNNKKIDIGPAFVLSLDTELAWGTLSTHGPSYNREIYLNTPEAVQKLLNVKMPGQDLQGMRFVNR